MDHDAESLEIRFPRNPYPDNASTVLGIPEAEALLRQESQTDGISTRKDAREDEKHQLRKRFVFHRHVRLTAKRRPGPEKRKEREKISDRVPAMKLQYQRLKLWIMLLYSMVTFFSWTLTCILCFRPIRLATYHDQGNYTRKQYEDNNTWTTVARVSSAIISAITIPVTSAICAKAAVAYCQTPPGVDEKGLTMRQTLALADKGWSDIRILGSLLRPKFGRRVGSRLLIFSALLCGIGISIPTLQGALIDTVHAKTMTREDLKPPLVGEIGWEAILLAPLGSKDSLPGASKHLDSSMIEYITDVTFTSSFDEVTTNIWTPEGARQTQIGPLLSANNSNWFLSLLPAGTDTGILPQLSLRFNSSLQCNNISKASFPDLCAGSNTFETSFSNAASISNITNYDTEPFSFRLCATDGSGGSFSHGDRDRQDISEYLYLDLTQRNFSNTYQCRLDTTTGYFELPNYWNNQTAGNLLAKWPQDRVYQDEFYQQNSTQNASTGTNQRVNDNVSRLPRHQVRRDSTSLKGPLLISAMAIFGNGTFFDKVASSDDFGSAGAQTCSELQRPFMGLFPARLSANPSDFTPNDPELQCQPYRNGLLAQYLLEWLYLTLSPPNLYNALRATTTIASKALTEPDWYNSGRAIYTSAGTDILKLHMSPGAMATISALIALQLVGLLSLAVYASTRPTWTESLDSFAILRFGAAMAAELPSISSLEAKHVAVLDEKEGWVGHQKSNKALKRLILGGSMRPRSDELYRLVDPGKRARFYLYSNGGKTMRIYRG